MTLLDRPDEQIHAELGNQAPAIFALLTRQELCSLFEKALDDPGTIESVDALGELLKEVVRHGIPVPFNEHINPAVIDALLASSIYSGTKLRKLDVVYKFQWVVMSESQKDALIDYCNATFGGEDLLLKVAQQATHLTDKQLKKLLLSPYNNVRNLACEEGIVGGKELVDELRHTFTGPRRSPADFSRFLCMNDVEFSATRVPLDRSVDVVRSQ